MKSVTPYSSLAVVYDAVMAHVDYEAWADYILHLIDEFGWDGESEDAPSPTAGMQVLELGAGTGLLTEELLAQTDWTMLVTDGSSPMLAVAKVRLNSLDSLKQRIRFQDLDFSTPWEVAGDFDCQLLLYDGFNYLLDTEQVENLFASVKKAGRPRGLLVFDQSTPHNSINNADFFEDDGEKGALRYHRKSHFDIEIGIHTTEFEISGPDGVFQEVHRQRAWTRVQVIDLLAQTDLEVIASLDGFSLDPAHDESERIHWVVRLPG
jgi:SAM-dependent methyltransferase